MPDTMLTALFGLVGVLVGGLVTYLTTQAIEVQRWKQQKADKLVQDRREALRAVAEWLDPIDRATRQAIVLAWPRAYAWPMKSRESSLTWRDVVQQLDSLTIAPSLRFLLPATIQDAFDVIRQQFFDIETISDLIDAIERKDANPPVVAPADIEKSRNDLLDGLNNLKASVDKYRALVRDEYTATYH